MKTYTQEFREKTVADCLASGMSQPKFAEKIGVSLSTLKTWIYSRPDCRPAKFVDLTMAAGGKPAGEIEAMRASPDCLAKVFSACRSKPSL